MARTYSSNYHKQVNTTAGVAPLILLEIDSVDLPVPIRVVNDNTDITHLGNVFIAMAFNVRMPDDLEQGMPSAELSIDNVGREITQWLDVSGGGKGASVRFIQVMRDAQDVVEWETTLELSNVSQSPLVISGALGYQDIFNQQGVAWIYSKDLAPGLY